MCSPALGGVLHFWVWRSPGGGESDHPTRNDHVSGANRAAATKLSRVCQRQLQTGYVIRLYRRQPAPRRQMPKQMPKKKGGWVGEIDPTLTAFLCWSRMHRIVVLRADGFAVHRPNQPEPMMTITITAFERSPDRGRGLARDMRVRWALEEVDQPYDVRLLSFSAMKESAHLALHPFGQIPTYEEGDLALFESARAITWMFAALATVEPPLVDREIVMREERDKPWHEQRLPIVEDRARKPLGELSSRLGDAEWLDGTFSAGDLLMVAVLFRSKGSGILDEYPNLSAYVARGEARPAFRRAFDAQLAVFTSRLAAQVMGVLLRVRSRRSRRVPSVRF
jgi:glutathione S-transferase